MFSWERGPTAQYDETVDLTLVSTSGMYTARHMPVDAHMRAIISWTAAAFDCLFALPPGPGYSHHTH
jgi:hypothetical protein